MTAQPGIVSEVPGHARGDVVGTQLIDLQLDRHAADVVFKVRWLEICESILQEDCQGPGPIRSGEMEIDAPAHVRVLRGELSEELSNLKEVESLGAQQSFPKTEHRLPPLAAEAVVYEAV